MTDLVVAISAFQSDEAVLALLDAVYSRPHAEVCAVIVVDSLGSGAIAAAIAERGWTTRYENSELNLGAAGNLARRLELAAEAGAQWALCLNHDGRWDPDGLSAMLDAGRGQTRVGAVYPLLYNGTRGKPWEDGRTKLTPFSARLTATRPTGPRDVAVAWGSSNGALYNLGPLKAGLTVPVELWHGYEDLGYGAVLRDHGWLQLLCREAVLRDAYNYAPGKAIGARVTVTDKPAWYTYYTVRNILLIHKRRRQSVHFSVAVAAKIIREVSLVLLIRDEKLTRLRYLSVGLLHGLAGRGGKWKLPQA